MEKKLIDKVNSLPKVPGVYIFYNSRGTVIYVGKAKNLKSRVTSYFRNKFDEGTKTQKLVGSIYDLEYIEVLSEFEALILEATLIKRYRPRYNVILKDDKSHLYIVIRSERFKRDGKYISIPKVITCRETDLNKGDVYFGPFPSAGTARYLVSLLRKVFPFRDCSRAKLNRYFRIGKPCLYGHINLCSAPCLGDSDLKEYKKSIFGIKRILSGEGSSLINSFERKMNHAAKNLNYEEAAYYRDILEKFEYVRTHITSPQQYINNPYLVEDLIEMSLNELMNVLPILENIPNRIECYDISNVSGKDATGSMVVACQGRFEKSEYRRFKVNLKDSPDDYSMMAEVLSRRLKRQWDLPDLIVLDGGKGQVSAGLMALEEAGLKIPLIGLAKKEETIVYVDENGFKQINLPESNEGLKLLQRLRDEAHRFARSYHVKLRIKKLRT